MNVKPSVMAVRPVETNPMALFFVLLNQLFWWLISRRSRFPASINQNALDVRDPSGLTSAVESDNKGFKPLNESSACLCVCAYWGGRRLKHFWVAAERHVNIKLVVSEDALVICDHSWLLPSAVIFSSLSTCMEHANKPSVFFRFFLLKSNQVINYNTSWAIKTIRLTLI